MIVVLLMGILIAFILENIFPKIADDIITYNVQGTTQQIAQEVRFYQKLVFDREFDGVVEEASTASLLLYSYLSIYSDSSDYRYQYNDMENTNYYNVIGDKDKKEYLNKNKAVIVTNGETNDKNGFDTFSIIRSISTLKGEHLGFIEFQQSYMKLEDICQINGDIFILNPWGETVYPTITENPITKEEISRIDNKNGYFIKDNIFYSWERIKNYNCIVVIRQDRNILFESLEQLKSMMLIVISVMLCLTLVFIILISRIILEPIQKLKEQIMKVNFENMQIKPTARFYVDEVQLFQDAFGEMLARLKKSLEERIAFQKEQDRAKYEAFQAQISPHFIHNTLYSISIAAQESREPDVVSMCKQLSDMMRYTASSKSTMVKLKEELAVPRICLQPFVENSISHGFRESTPPYEINIDCTGTDEEYRITIHDNGCGFEEDTLNDLMRKIENTEFAEIEGIGGMGIVNTVMRLKYVFLDRIEVTIRNSNPGAMIEIRIGKVENV